MQKHHHYLIGGLGGGTIMGIVGTFATLNTLLTQVIQQCDKVLQLIPTP